MHELYVRFKAVTALHPDKIAIAKDKETTTFAALRDMAAAAAPLLAEAGVGHGRPLVVSSTNTAAVAANILATWALESFPVLVSPDAPTAHLDHAIDVSGAAALLATDGLNTLTPKQHTDDLPSEIGSVVFTSGSSGNPKGVMQSTANLMSGAARISDLFGYRPDDKILCPVSWTHDYGWGQLLSCLLQGTSMVLPALPSVQSLSDAIELHHPTILAGTPSVFAGMVYGISNIRSADLSSVRLVTSTGSHLLPELVSDLSVLLPNSKLYANYGLTETYRSCSLHPDDRDGREMSVGRALPGVTITAVDDSGTPVPHGTLGTLIHAGAGVCLGYLRDPDRTSELFFQMNAVRTGDIGMIDANGFVYLQGRKDRMIKTMDVQVALDAVERTLSASGLVTAVAVVTQPDKSLGRKIIAYAVLKNVEDGAALKQYARANLTKFQLPRSYHFPNALPRTPSGKVDYVTLSK
ncbi:long-chain fatty acid--CoA ligase [Loktanella sp. SALINAS62]|uniref:class I adenylate-forming enzyme family protein n=1 Tax=Loktanella sp. SALINAS62 TaxID=2706124 RepID=UPI001B8CE9F1|nr:long-chain fatty acid--CoA ligase [Loktanella sp. SALINAS62]MBS1301529.1 AMP-binding protein [Loktanella sp. SALINAS62]